MNPLLLKPAVMAAILAGVVVLAFGAGWMVEGWRKGRVIERISGENTLLETAQRKCTIDVHNARQAVGEITRQVEQLEKLADQAMREAEPQVLERKATITRIRALPAVDAAKQCEAVMLEQAAYVRDRRK